MLLSRLLPGGGVTRARPARVVDAEAMALTDLDAAIARRREELAVLERAKEILSSEGT